LFTRNHVEILKDGFGYFHQSRISAVYQLNVILIGCHEDAVPHVRRELTINRANIESEYHDVADTLEALGATKTKKRLLILQLKRFECLEELDRLCQALPNWPVMVLVETGGDDRMQLNSAFLGAMRMGASQIVGLPLHAEDFKTALDRLAMQFVYSATGPSNIIAVAGVTGGCGATSLAINLGQAISHLRNKRCVLVDLSLKLGAVASHLNIEPPRSINDLLCDVKRVDETLIRDVLFKISENFELLAGPDHLVATLPHSSADIMRLLDLMKPLCDVILLDIPCTYDDFYFELLAGSSQIVLVGEQKVPSIRALKLVREMVGRDQSPELEHLVINRFDKNAMSLSVPLLIRILGVKRLHTIVHDESSFSSASVRGCTLRLSSPRSQALAEIDALATRLLDGDASIDGRSRGMSGVSRLIHAIV
jgi:pilus assembly protein CpaE